MRSLLARKTRESLSEAALFTFEEKVLPAGSSLAFGSQRRMRQRYQLVNGSEIIVAGLDKPEKIMSTEYDLIYVQEATECEERDIEMLTTRLRNAVRRLRSSAAKALPSVNTLSAGMPGR